MKLNYKIILFVFLIFSVFAISAQNKKDKNIVLASGTVYNPQGIPLSNVVITVDEGKSKYTTHIDGKYTFSTVSRSIFLFECLGYEDLVLSVTQLKRLENNVIMIPKDLAKLSNTFVNLPYQKKRLNKVVGNISVIDAQQEYQRDSRTDITSAIQGKISGSLGGMNINGLGSAFTVVDGIPMGTGYTDLRDVEQIVVLKMRYLDYYMGLKAICQLC